MTQKALLTIACLVLTLQNCIYAEHQKTLLPIVLVHGILSDDHEMAPIIEHINKYLPGTYIKNVKLGLGTWSSFWNMYTLVDWLKEELQNDEQLHNGYSIIAHSQGGLVARYFIQRYNSPKAHTYISWGTPHQGIFGTPSTIDDTFTFLNSWEERVSSILYSYFFQHYVSFASYWHDPLQHDAYLEQCCFLPYLNNEKQHEHYELFKQNICSLQNMVLVNSTQETIIEPAVSCHFGFYQHGSHSAIESLEQTTLYSEDHLGIRSLAESGRLHLKMASCSHIDYQEDERNFVENTLPFLQQATA